MKFEISASLMAGGFTQEAIDKVQYADRIHIDIMDGQFVENKTIGAAEVACLKSKKPKDAHLMIVEPEKHIDKFARTGVSRISFHAETTENPIELISKIKSYKIEAGLAIDAETPVQKIIPFLDKADFVLVMSVKAGKGGQNFMPESLQKIRLIKEKCPKIIIEIDGGINNKTAKLAIKAGATVLVSGSYLFKGNIEQNVRELKKIES